MGIIGNNVQQYLDIWNQVKDYPLFNDILFFNHAIICAVGLRGALAPHLGKKSFPLFAGIFLLIVGGFGGAIINDILCGRTLFLLSNDLYIGAFAVAWIFITCVPGSLLYYIFGTLPVQTVTYAIEGYFVSSFIFLGVQSGIATFPTSRVAPILMGTIAATGGFHLQPFFLNAYVGKQVAQPLLFRPNFLLYIPMLCSIFYYLTVQEFMIPHATQFELDGVIIKIDVNTAIQLVCVLEFMILPFYFRMSTPKAKKDPTPSTANKSKTTAQTTNTKQNKKHIANKKNIANK